MCLKIAKHWNACSLYSVGFYVERTLGSEIEKVIIHKRIAVPTHYTISQVEKVVYRCFPNVLRVEFLDNLDDELLLFKENLEI